MGENKIFPQITKVNDGVYDYYYITVIDQNGKLTNLQIRNSHWKTIEKYKKQQHLPITLLLKKQMSSTDSHLKIIEKIKLAWSILWL